MSLLFAKVFVAILLGYADYLPPNFNRGFLIGREHYFFGIYRIAFYTHLIFGPLALVLGALLFMSGHGWLSPRRVDHRRLGKIQAVAVLGGVVPSGLVMSSPAFIDSAASPGLVAQALATGVTMWIAILRAKQCHLESHKVWATRCFLLLLSPLVLRITNGIFIALDVQSDRLMVVNAWLTLLIPLALYEFYRLRPLTSLSTHSQTSKGLS